LFIFCLALALSDFLGGGEAARTDSNWFGSAQSSSI